MVAASSLQLSDRFVISNSYYAKQTKCTTRKGKLHFFCSNKLKPQLHFFSPNELVKDAWSIHLLGRSKWGRNFVSPKHTGLLCQAVLSPEAGDNTCLVQSTALVLKRAFNCASRSSDVFKLLPAISIISFALWGLTPLVQLSWNTLLKSSRRWNESRIYYITNSYVRPLLLWTGTMLLCRTLDTVALPVQASGAVKQQLVHFIRSLSTTMAFAYCFSSLINQYQQFSKDSGDPNDAKNAELQKVGISQGILSSSLDPGVSSAATSLSLETGAWAVHAAMWIAAISLFMELHGFVTQKWLTAGGLGTLILTLAGREIFTNFLSSVVIHATRPFILNDMIQSRIDGNEVSGKVEHVGWWSPTIIRGDDREAVHIPSHKLTANVVRNQSRKTHRRIQTHFAISHLGLAKINYIVADMRKVLGKNPQVEQQKLHRRVFLDYVDPESQALVILVSCFVRTSHIEEYLTVKEAVLLDLLKVISHHRVHLATPIRTIQRTYIGDDDAEDVPFSGSQGSAYRPLQAIDPCHTRNKAKSPVQTDRKKDIENQDGKAAASISSSVPSSKPSSTTKKRDNGKIKDMPSAQCSSIPKKDGINIAAASSREAALEDNIVLGVVLNGSKRSLPIEGMSEDADTRKLAACPTSGDEEDQP